MSNTEPNRNDLLALDRTRMAAERTLMAWTRTSLAMISFGFTIYKFMQALQVQSAGPALHPQAPRNVALTLIGLGTSSLIAACIQHKKYMKSLDPDRPRTLWELTFIVAVALGLIGVLMFGNILFRSGPFG